MIDPIEAHKKFQEHGLPAKYLKQILDEIKKLPSDRLDVDRKARIITFFKGFSSAATLDDTKAFLVSANCKEFCANNLVT